MAFAKSLANESDSFSQWAHKYILSSFSEWKEVMDPEEYYPQGIMSDCFHAIGINLNYYWLLECKDSQEMISLLRYWHDKKNDGKN